MREIKFRGKRIDNNEWFYGYLWVNNTVTRETVYIIDEQGDMYQVDPETVGQYTGLKDKNNKEIYDGDILQTDIYPGENYCIEIAVDEDPPHNFIYGWRKKPNALVRGISDGIYTILGSGRNFKDSVVIGNIYDNPELLEVANAD